MRRPQTPVSPSFVTSILLSVSQRRVAVVIPVPQREVFSQQRDNYDPGSGVFQHTCFETKKNGWPEPPGHLQLPAAP
jgi:hypothetical protein